MLGPRFIEFDRQIRLADPLLQAGPPVMAQLSEAVAGAQLLCSFYGDRVLTIHIEQTDRRIRTPMERGRPFPLFLGAPSRIILAHLPAHQLRNLFLNHPKEIAEAGLGETWQAFRERLKAIRRAGYYVGSEIAPSLVGVAAAVFRAEGAVVGCLCLVRLRAKAGDLDKLGELAMAGAGRISKALRGGGAPTFPAARFGRRE